MERLQIPPTVSPIPGIEPFIQMFSKNTHAEDVTKHDTFRAGRGGGVAERGAEEGEGRISWWKCHPSIPPRACHPPEQRDEAKDS